MEWLGPVLTALISKLDPISIILIIMLGYCNWSSMQTRKEERADKQALIAVIDSTNKVLERNTNVLSVALGKVIQ